jgi:bifunctional DNA-binding transcriptional regulator/antitoxin component of YhaV-PrlF toxin-antitoxin module
MSPDYKIEVPEEIRKALGIKPGEEVVFMNINGRIRLLSVRPMREYRGILKGVEIDMSTIREKKDREF